MLHQRECQRLSKLQFTRVNGTQMECCPHFKKHRYLFPCEKISGSHRPDLHQKLVASKGGSDMGVAPFFAAFGFFVFWLPAFWDCAQAQSSRRGKTWSWDSPEAPRRRTLRKKTRAQTPSFPATPHKVSWKEGWIPKVGLQDIKM